MRKRSLNASRFLFMSCTLATALVAGCAAPSDIEESEPTEERLALIGQAYQKACLQLKAPPKNLEELRPFLKELGTPDELMKSENDEEAFVILWNVDFSKVEAGQPGVDPVLAYERRGLAGERLVLTMPPRVVTMTDEELRSAFFPAGHKPPS
jgi:hypothetical protein